jgi:hypothetical protein
MSLFRLPIQVKKWDKSIKKEIFVIVKLMLKNTLMTWSIVCKGKKEGLGVLNLDLMNKTLLDKLIIRYKDPIIQRC